MDDQKDDSNDRGQEIPLNKDEQEKIADEINKIVEQQQKIADMMSDSLYPFLRSQQRLRALVERTYSLSSLFQSYTEHIFTGINAINAALKTRVDWSAVRNAFDAFESIKVNLRPFTDKRDKFHLLLMTLGWPPPMDIVAGWVPRLGNEYEKYREGELTRDELEDIVNTVIINSYGEKKLKSMADEWSEHPLLTSRKKIIKDAINAHNNKKYTLSIPALLPLIDYLSAKTFAHQGKLVGEKRAEYLTDILSDKRLDPLQKREVFETFIEDFLYSQAEYGERVPAPMSRHGILHGIEGNYNTEVNSLKIILFIDHIVGCLNYLTSSASNKFHQYGCYHSKEIEKENKLFLRSSYLTKRSGLVPCQSCFEEEEERS